MRNTPAWALLLVLFVLLFFTQFPASADSLIINTGSPDALIAIASRPESPGKIEIEAADDFVLGGTTSVTGGSFVGARRSQASARSLWRFIRSFPITPLTLPRETCSPVSTHPQTLRSLRATPSRVA
jgi:hypothetical protein